MRTAILAGSIYIGDALGAVISDTVGWFYTIILLACVVMDIVDFVRGRKGE